MAHNGAGELEGFTAVLPGIRVMPSQVAFWKRAAESAMERGKVSGWSEWMREALDRAAGLELKGER